MKKFIYAFILDCSRASRGANALRWDQARRRGLHRHTPGSGICLELVPDYRCLHQPICVFGRFAAAELRREARRIGHSTPRSPLPFLLNLPNTATAPAPQGALGLGSNYFAANSNQQYAVMAFAKQLYGRYHFGVKESQSIQAGRFEFNDATELAPKNATLATLKRDRVSQRLIGTFGFSDVGRSFDGLRYSWTQPRTGFPTFIGATPTRGRLQTDGWGWNRVAFAHVGHLQSEWGTR